jgi:hypothetical protein
MFCAKLIDLDGNEHIILVLNKYAKIDFEDGSNIVRYEFNGKSNILFGKDKLNKADYDIDVHKVVGIDCTTGESFIMDFNLFDLSVMYKCGINEISESGLYVNIPTTYYTVDEEDDTLVVLALRFIKEIRTTLNLEYVNLLTDYDNNSASSHRVELNKLPLVIEKYAFINTQYLDTDGEWKDDTLQVVDGEVGGLIKCKNDLNESFYLY